MHFFSKISNLKITKKMRKIAPHFKGIISIKICSECELNINEYDEKNLKDYNDVLPSIASGLGISYDSLSNNFGKVSYLKVNS